MALEYVQANTTIRGTKTGVDAGRLASADENLRMSLLGQQYVADWKYFLSAAGRMYRISVPEHATGGADLTLATGNATVDLDQPELLVSVPQGFRLIPVEFNYAMQIDVDAYDDEQEVYLFADRTQAYATATGTPLTPQNQLDGGRAFPGFACSIISADITDPAHSEILHYNVWELTQVAAETAGSGIPNFSARVVWDFPNLLAGPCAIVGIIAGTNAPTFMANLLVGCVPDEWFPTV